jgi:hypothetical protein
VFAAKESIVYVLDPTRAHDVPESHFGPDASGILSVDRYSAYKAMSQVKAGTIRLAFCWAHVRRDFLEVLTGWSELTDWAWSWVEEIGQLYHLNDQRVLAKKAEASTDTTPTTTTEKLSTFAEADRRVREQSGRVCSSDGKAAAGTDPIFAVEPVGRGTQANESDESAAGTSSAGRLPSCRNVAHLSRQPQCCATRISQLGIGPVQRRFTIFIG